MGEAWATALTGLAALLGAALAYVGARAGSRPERAAVVQSERDEWGRRFGVAIDLLIDPDPQRRLMGRAMVDSLLRSDLAQADDRHLAEALLRAAALAGLPPSVNSLGSPDSSLAPHTRFAVDEVAFVQDDGGTTHEEGP